MVVSFLYPRSEVLRVGYTSTVNFSVLLFADAWHVSLLFVLARHTVALFWYKSVVDFLFIRASVCNKN